MAWVVGVVLCLVFLGVLVLSLRTLQQLDECLNLVVDQLEELRDQRRAYERKESADTKNTVVCDDPKTDSAEDGR